MSRRHVMLAAVVAGLMGAAMIVPTAAQERPGQRGGFDPEQLRERMEQAQQRRLDALRRQLDVNDEEWAAIEPRLATVLELQQRHAALTGAGQGFGRGGFGPGGPGGQRGGGEGRPRGRFGPRGQQSDAGGADAPVIVLAQERPGRGAGRGGEREGRGGFGWNVGPEAQHMMRLRRALQDENAGADEIREALDSFREAREGLAGELREARDNLRELLNLRREAVLVAGGILD